jgi:5-methylcytosine-specific restriction endonuclease McrA
MPMERERYPSDWNLIAKQIREDSHWQCQGCGKPCRKPREAIADFESRIEPVWTKTLVEIICDDSLGVVARYRPRRFLLTVAHLDQEPSNNSPENLKALCAPCHLRYDTEFRGYNRRRKREREGQMNLFTDYPGGEQT